MYRRPSVVDAARTSLKASEVSSTLTDYRNLQKEIARVDVLHGKGMNTTMVNQYYDLVTDFYEYGWGTSFHFAARHRGESFEESILRHEHQLALRMGLRPGMNVLDVGCGVGGPMRNIARLVDVRITGVNINEYQIRRAETHNRRAGLEKRLDFLPADFSSLPVDDACYDAAYAIESTCHAVDRTIVFSEIFRILKAGACFAGYEWCMTHLYRSSDGEHRALKERIEEGDALPSLSFPGDIDFALRRAGFESVEGTDLAPTCDAETPWYLPISGKEWTMRGLPRTRLGRFMSHNLIHVLERVRAVPQGATALSLLLNRTADALVRAGELGIFTPMYFFVARKPCKI